MNRSRTQSPSHDPEGYSQHGKSGRQATPMRADRFDRHRSHHREHLCHDIRCQEADQEIREVLRRY